MRRVFCWLTCLCLGHEWSRIVFREGGEHVVTLRVCVCCSRRDWVWVTATTARPEGRQ